MIIDNTLSIIDIDAQVSIPKNYLITDSGMIVHRYTGLNIAILPDDIAIRFVGKWGYNSIFDFGLIDCYYHNQIELEDIDRQVLINKLIYAYSINEYHPLGWLLYG